jgi:hypothetical protein
MSGSSRNQIPCSVCKTGLVGLGKGQICAQCRITYNLGKQEGAPEPLPKIIEFLHRANSSDIQRILVECTTILANRRQQAQSMWLSYKSPLLMSAVS